MSTPRRSADKIRTPDLNRTCNVDLHDTHNQLAPNGHVTQEESGGSAGTLTVGATRSLVKMGAENSDDTWEPLLASDENTIRTYFECRLSELRVRKRNNDKEICRLQILMDDSLMKDISDLRMGIMREDRVGPLRDYFLDQCSIFERDLQQPKHKSVIESLEPEVKKLKISNNHEAKIRPNREINSHGTTAVSNREINSHETTAVSNIDINSHETTAVPDREINSHGTMAVSNIDINSHGTMAVPDREINSHETTAVSNIDINSHETTAVPDREINSHGTTAVSNIDINSHGTMAVPDREINSHGTTAVSNIDINSNGTTAVPDRGVNACETELGLNIDEVLNTRVHQTSGRTLVTSLEAPELVQESHETSTGAKSHATIGSQELLTSTGAPVTNEDHISSNTGQALVANGNDGCSQSAATNPQGDTVWDPTINNQGDTVWDPTINNQVQAIRVQVTKTPEEAIGVRAHAPQGPSMSHDNTATQKQPTISHDETTTQKQPAISHDETTTQKQPNMSHDETTTQKQPAISHDETTTQKQPAISHDETTTQKQPAISHDETTTQKQLDISHDETTTQKQLAISHDETTTQKQLDISHDDIITSMQTASPTLDASSPVYPGSATERVDSSRSETVRKLDATTSTDDFHSTQTAALTSADCCSIDLLLIGNCGNGKSATGNSILGKNVFQRSASSSVAASSITTAATTISGKVVNVVDGPSINVAGNITPDELDKVTQNIHRALDLCKFAFNALVITLKFGNRFTKQEMEALRVIKAVLGKDVIREYGVCVITFGDNFEYAVEDAREDGEVLTFEGWLKAQTGEVTKLLEECSFRCVLFDNMTKDSSKQQKQINNLINILPKGKKYSQHAFIEAWEGAQKLEQEANLPNFLKQARAEINNLDELIEQAGERQNQDQIVQMLHSKLSQLKEKVYKWTTKSSEIETLKLSLQMLECKLRTKIKGRIERNVDGNGSVPAQPSAPALNHYSVSNTTSGTFGKAMDNLPVGAHESSSKTRASSYLGSHVVSPSQATSHPGSWQCVPNSNTTINAAPYLGATEVRGQDFNSHANIHSFDFVDGSPGMEASTASFADIIRKRVMDFVNSFIPK